MLPTDQPYFARAEPKTLRERLLHTATRSTRGQRKVYLRLAEHWARALAPAKAFTRRRTMLLPRPDSQLLRSPTTPTLAEPPVFQ